MFLSDRLTLDAPRITSEGYMAVRARAARKGIYEYIGAEVDPSGTKFKPTDTVRIFRPDDEVFARDAVHSFLMKPITDDHPSEPVTSSNWADKARGVVAGAMRDGDYLAFDLVLMDAKLIADVQSGKKELSNGYATDLKFEAGTAPDGSAYDAVQRSIRGNHVAVVKAGRAGPECRIADSIALCDSAPTNLFVRGDNKMPDLVKIVRDGIPVEVTNDAKTIIDGLDAKIKKLTDDLAAANTQVGTLTATVSTKDGEIAALNSKLTDAALTPAKLDAAVAARAKIVDAAKLIKADIAIDGKTDAEIKRAAVAAKLGDAAAAMDDAAINGAFAVLAVTKDGLAQALNGGVIVNQVDAGTYQAGLAASKKMADGFNAWRKDN